MAETLLKDIRYALRWMRRSPGFSAVAILSLGLGVGVNTAMFSLVDSLLFRPLPVTSPDTLVDVFTTGGDGDEYATSSYQDFLDLKAQNTVFTDMMGYSPMMAPLSLGGDRSRISLGQVVTVESLHDARRAAAPRPPAGAVRRRSRRAARRRDLAPHVAARVRQRPCDRRQDADAARTGLTRSSASRRSRSPASCRC